MNPSGVFDVAQAALDCVCSAMDALADAEYPGCPCLQYISAGEPQIDCCTSDCAGMLTTHIETVYPSDVFPGAFEGFEPCKAATWVALLVVTASRCAPSTDEQGNLPPQEDLTEAARIQALDHYAVLTALSCCLEPPPGKRRRRVVIQGSTPLVSEGGCSAIEVRALVDVGAICGCPPATS